MSVRDKALLAHDEREHEKWRAQQAKEAALAEEQVQREANANNLIRRSKLGEWFPGEEWDVMDYRKKGQSSQYKSDGNEIIVAPTDRSVYVSLSYGWDSTTKTHTAEVEHVAVRRYNETHGWDNYWSGVVVNSAADVGAWISAQDEQ